MVSVSHSIYWFLVRHVYHRALIIRMNHYSEYRLAFPISTAGYKGWRNTSSDKVHWRVPLFDQQLGATQLLPSRQCTVRRHYLRNKERALCNHTLLGTGRQVPWLSLNHFCSTHQERRSVQSDHSKAHAPYVQQWNVFALSSRGTQSLCELNSQPFYSACGWRCAADALTKNGHSFKFSDWCAGLQPILNHHCGCWFDLHHPFTVLSSTSFKWWASSFNSNCDLNPVSIMTAFDLVITAAI